MRGRRPAGAEYVEKLAGPAQAKKRLRVVLATLQGSCRVQDACRQLGLGPARFHELRRQILEAGLAALGPRPAGRPARVSTPAQQHVAALQAALAAKEVEVRAAQARAEIAVVLPHGARADGTPAQKRSAGGGRR